MKKIKLILIFGGLGVFIFFFFLYTKTLHSRQKVKGVATKNEMRYEKKVGTTRIILKIRPAKKETIDSKKEKYKVELDKKKRSDKSSLNLIQSLRQILDYIINIFQSN